jgi:glycine/D-amino acid oxidase-like deaminating enzyme
MGYNPVVKSDCERVLVMRIPLVLDKAMLLAAKTASVTEPIADRVFPEKLEIDDNRSLWAAYTPDYQAGKPLQGDIDVDLAIIGGGFTGVSTAYHFSRQFPEKRVALLEAKTLANGASGRNGGMMLNWVTDSSAYVTEEGTRRVYDVTSAGIRTITEIIRRHALDVSHRVDGSLEVYTDAARAETAARLVEQQRAIGIPVEFLDRATLKARLNLEGAHGAILDPNAGQLNGAQYVRALRPVLIEQGVEIYEQTTVERIREGRVLELITAGGTVRAKAIVLGTNGYTPKLGYLRDALFPLHSHVFATDPLSAEQQQELGWRAHAGFSDDYDRISYSVLTKEGHLVFGGGSNQSYQYLFGNRTAYPGSPDTAQKAFQRMGDTLGNYLPMSRKLPIRYRWTGTLGITLKRNNLMGVMGEHRNIFYAVGYCGHGVTLANIAGQVMTDMISGDDQAWRDLPFYQAKHAVIPPEPFRWIGYQLFTRLTGKSPRV